MLVLGYEMNSHFKKVRIKSFLNSQFAFLYQVISLDKEPSLPFFHIIIEGFFRYNHTYFRDKVFPDYHSNYPTLVHYGSQYIV